MKIISSIEEVLTLDRDISKFIISSCPWITEEDYDPTRIGFVFILEGDDINKTKSICIVPHIADSDDNTYKTSMTIKLESFDLFEPPATFDSKSRYWNFVLVCGQEFGASIFLSSRFAESLPTLHERLRNIQELK